MEKMNNITDLKYGYLHWKCQKRWNKAWKRAKRRANSFYREDIASCNPWCYFQEELNDLKRK